MNKWIIAISVLLLSSSPAFAQEADVDSVKMELYKLNRVFDSSRYLAFDVRFRYNTDTTFGKFESEEQVASYVLNNRHFYFSMGDDEYVQTDSFLFSVYNDEKMLVMSHEPAVAISEKFPVRPFIDSIIGVYDSAYSIRAFATDSICRISFTARTDSMPYSRFMIEYYEGSYLPVRFEIETLGHLDVSEIPDSLLSKVSIKRIRQRVEMIFENYSFPPELEMFKRSKYVVYDKYRKQYRLAEKYRGYRFITSGVPGNDFDPNAEVRLPDVEEEPAL